VILVRVTRKKIVAKSTRKKEFIAKNARKFNSKTSFIIALSLFARVKSLKKTRVMYFSLFLIETFIELL
jgi:hypothetical protein